MASGKSSVFPGAVGGSFVSGPGVQYPVPMEVDLHDGSKAVMGNPGPSG